MRAKALLLVTIFGFVLVAASTEAAAPGDITYERQDAGEGANIAPAVFPHWRHRIRFRCFVCHDGLYEMKAGVDRTTMEQIRDGESCGLCHDGKTAFISDFTSCHRCHKKEGEDRDD